ncbi:NAD(P)/FAD-dependent oxidoreductase [Actinoplanes sp. NBRC 103695]|uniref:flavin-containing monooxygenase n=1 Tax=Actinoplanes sp. NBRC 103695 TaxID=3032202 RepID=UPI0024A14DE6|nr:NAD(P)/FAD-dependent oxidoreductase [Actinoplanes sp. NBRC 103695]GLZ01706.1 monooxygenase [Actinoplanes sp. NBRC 103695]
MNNVTVLGAGAAGLAVAAELKARGVDSVVLERGAGVGASWRGRYDRLRLHTTRRLSGLPGMPIPREYGRWVRRDDLVRYLEAYAQKFDLDVRTGAAAGKVTRVDGGWQLHGVGRTTGTLVVAIGYLHTPLIPAWPGRESWTGSLTHSAEYRNAEPFRGKDVLVVGIGNSGAEIASDLAEGGAASVRLAIRTPPHIVDRTTAGWPAQLSGLLMGGLPESVVNPVSALLAKDLSASGIPRPVKGLKTRLRTERYVPLQDVGIVRDVRAGRVRPVAAVRGFTESAVELADGTSVRPDAVIAATGYGTGLRDLFDEPSLFDESGIPVVHGGEPALQGLYFMGYDVNLGGMLRQVGIEARTIASRIARS